MLALVSVSGMKTFQYYKVQKIVMNAGFNTVFGKFSPVREIKYSDPLIKDRFVPVLPYWWDPAHSDSWKQGLEDIKMSPDRDASRLLWALLETGRFIRVFDAVPEDFLDELIKVMEYRGTSSIWVYHQYIENNLANGLAFDTYKRVLDSSAGFVRSYAAGNIGKRHAQECFSNIFRSIKHADKDVSNYGYLSIKNLVKDHSEKTFPLFIHTLAQNEKDGKLLQKFTMNIVDEADPEFSSFIGPMIYLMKDSPKAQKAIFEVLFKKYANAYKSGDADTKKKVQDILYGILNIENKIGFEGQTKVKAISIINPEVVPYVLSFITKLDPSQAAALTSNFLELDDDRLNKPIFKFLMQLGPEGRKHLIRVVLANNKNIANFTSDYQPQSSQCQDVGNNTAPGISPLDLNNGRRIKSQTVDLGAIEVQ
jgi:hypothetical protein